ncbi:small, acid-soluble spore protein, alpha/beta type [Mediterraneibacter sp.]
MGKKKEKPINLNELEEEEKMKYEIAEELGLLDRVLAQGWKSLTSKETGRIGGLVTKRRREQEDRTAQPEKKYRKQEEERQNFDKTTHF